MKRARLYSGTSALQLVDELLEQEPQQRRRLALARSVAQLGELRVQRDDGGTHGTTGARRAPRGWTTERRARFARRREWGVQSGSGRVTRALCCKMGLRAAFQRMDF